MSRLDDWRMLTYAFRPQLVNEYEPGQGIMVRI